MSKNYYEIQIIMLNDKIYEQECCLKNTNDVKTQAEIKFRIAKMTIEREKMMIILKEML